MSPLVLICGRNTQTRVRGGGGVLCAPPTPFPPPGGRGLSPLSANPGPRPEPDSLPSGLVLSRTGRGGSRDAFAVVQ